MTPYSARPAQELELVVIECTLDPATAGIFQMKAHIADRRSDVVQLDPEDSRWQPQQREDCAMVLHTSGSTGNKKVVPHTVEDLLIGAVAVAKDPTAILPALSRGDLLRWSLQTRIC